MSATRVGQGLGLGLELRDRARVRVRARARHCHLLIEQNFGTIYTKERPKLDTKRIPRANNFSGCCCSHLWKIHGFKIRYNQFRNLRG